MCEKRRHLFVCRHLGAGFDLILSGVAFDMAYKYVCVCVCVCKSKPINLYYNFSKYWMLLEILHWHTQ